MQPDSRESNKGSGWGPVQPWLHNTISKGTNVISASTQSKTVMDYLKEELKL